jgi:hypothetical protein
MVGLAGEGEHTEVVSGQNDTAVKLDAKHRGSCHGWR